MDLHNIRNYTLIAQSSTDELLGSHIIPYGEVIDDSFLLLPDTAKPHTARLVKNLFETETSQSIRSPAGSPDLNPIDHILCAFG